jgi:hypothetical protein
VQDREHEAQVGGDRRLLGEQLPDRLLDPVVAGVDLVVEGDDLVAQLDVLRRSARSTSEPCSWRVASSASRLAWYSIRAIVSRTGP